jgi:hypothetical protein
MTDQHRATPEQWADQEKWARDDADSSCILELRARVEAMEATQHAHADLSRLSDEKRDSAVRYLSKPGRWQPLRTEVTYGEANAHAQNLVRHLSMNQPAPSPAVDRVRDLQDRIRDGSLTLAEALAEIGAPTPAPAPADSLVERVVKVIADPDGPPELWHDEARAAILVVAEWLDERDTSIKDDLEAPFAEDCIVDDAIRWLQQEANQ